VQKIQPDLRRQLVAEIVSREPVRLVGEGPGGQSLMLLDNAMPLITQGPHIRALRQRFEQQG
jgi:hypothetical protein